MIPMGLKQFFIVISLWAVIVAEGEVDGYTLHSPDLATATDTLIVYNLTSVRLMFPRNHTEVDIADSLKDACEPPNSVERNNASDNTANATEVVLQDSVDQNEEDEIDVIVENEILPVPLATTDKQDAFMATSILEDGNETNEQEALQDMDEIKLPKNYNKYKMPKSRRCNRKPQLKAAVYVEIRSIGNIDEVKEEISLDMDLVLGWKDYLILEEYFPDCGDISLNEDSISLNPEFLKKLWVPDIYIVNLVDSQNKDVLDNKPGRFMLQKDGLLTYRTKSTVKLHCPLNFKFYPADTQSCNVTLRSYSHNIRNLDLAWFAPAGVYFLANSKEGISFDRSIGSRENSTQVQDFYHDGKTRLEEFAILRFTILVRRKLTYHLIQTYVPSVIFIIITWLSFIIPRHKVGRRLPIGMTTLLTLIAMFAAVRQNVPVVSYVKAIDIWMLSGISFVFACVVEFALLLWVETIKEEQDEEAKLLEREDYEKKVVKKTGIYSESFSKDGQDLTLGIRIRRWMFKKVGIVLDFIESYSFILVFSTIIAFISAYWSWLLINSGYLNWTVDPRHNFVHSSDGLNS